MDGVLPEAAFCGFIKIRRALRQAQEILEGHIQGRSSFGVQKLRKRHQHYPLWTTVK